MTCQNHITTFLSDFFPDLLLSMTIHNVSKPHPNRITLWWRQMQWVACWPALHFNSFWQEPLEEQTYTLDNNCIYHHGFI